MSNSENKTIPFRSVSNRTNLSLQKKEENIFENNQGEAKVENANQSPAPSGAKSFFASTKGIAILSVVGVVVVAAVVVSVVVTQVNKKENDEGNNEVNETIEIIEDTTKATIISEEIEETEETIHPHHTYGDNNEENFDDEVDDDEDKITEEENIDEYKSGIDPEQKYISPLSSLTKNNQMKVTISAGSERNVPTVGSVFNEEISEFIPVYGTSNTNSDQKYEEILEENKMLVTGENTYDEIDENGNLYLEGNSTGRTLYKHPFSVGLYGGNVSDTEKTVVKTITINPTSLTNYITGLYAPAGEVIKIEFAEGDLENIGGSLEFIIGQVTQDGGGSENSKSVGLKRIPILFNKLTIKKNPGYIGSFIGGPIYISNPSKKRQFTVTISNAVPYKHLIYGVTTKEEFEEMESYSAPFFELDVRDSIRYSGPLSVIKDFDYDNLVQNLIFWDKCVRTSRNIPNPSNINKGIHFLFDPCVNSPGAYALAYVGANWCQVPLSFGLALDYETITKYGAWGHIHELNHHFQRFGFHSSIQNEVTNNVVNLVEYILYSQISGLRNEFSTEAITTISGNHLFLDPEYALKQLIGSPQTSSNEIRFYEPILQAFGYDLFIQVTQYGKGAGGVDLFYRALTEVLQYDFTYYVEEILNLTISEEVINECQSYGYYLFVPVSSIYQTGRYYYHDSHQHFSNTSLPYRIPRGGPSKLDFENHIIVPNGFTYEIVEITDPPHGKLEKISDKIYTYTPDDIEDLSGIIKLTLHLNNSELDIHTNVKLGLNFQVDNSLSTQTNYLYDQIIYNTTIEDAIEKNFEGYSSINFFTNNAGAMTGIKEGNIGIWEGKFRIEEDGYKYIVYKGGRGPSVLYAKINDETEYQIIGYITENQDAYMFATPSYAYYQRDLNKNDVVRFKAYLLGKTLNAGSTGYINIGISKTNEVSQVKTLKKGEIFGVDYVFDQPYVFHSGDPYKTEKIFDSYSFFDYSLVEVTSSNFDSWDYSEVYSLDKMIDNDDNTYMHTHQSLRISKESPLIINFDLGKIYYFDRIIFNKGPTNNFYLPLNLNVLTSDDGENWEEKGEYTTEQSGDKLAILDFEETLYKRYIQLKISKQMSGNYIAIATISFIEKNLKLYQLSPEEAEMEGKNLIDINYDNFPYFGHSYILYENCAISFLVHEVTGMKIKVCNKFNSKVTLIVDNDKNDAKNIEIKETDNEDFPVEIRNLSKGKHRFKIEVNEGKFDFEYILYEK